MNMKETSYQSPKVNVIDICAESIICASRDNNVSVTNFWEGNEEEEW